MWRSVFFLGFLLASPAAVAADECPLDLNYVGTLPWNPSSCVPPITNTTACCVTLLSLVGIGLAERLRLTGLFHLPNATVSAACLNDFSSNLSALSLPSNLVSTCFPNPERFVNSPDFCDGILSAQNWTARLGSSTELNSACRSDLSVSTQCYACLNAGFAVASQSAHLLHVTPSAGPHRHLLPSELGLLTASQSPPRRCLFRLRRHSHPLQLGSPFTMEL